MDTEIIKSIKSSVIKKTGEIHLIIWPKHFIGISRELSGLIILNEILKSLNFDTFKSLKDVLSDEIENRKLLKRAENA